MIQFASSRSNSLVVQAGVLLCCIAWARGAIAVDLGENVQVHGFLSQAAAISDHNNVGGNSSDGFAFDLRELGGNVSWRPDPDWMVSAQLLARWSGRTDDGDVRLDYGFVDRTLVSGDDRLGIQLGKIKNPYGLYNITRDVAHTRPGILMPQSIYWDRIRDFVLAAPGISVYGESNHPRASLSWEASVLRPEVENTEVEYATFFLDMPGRLQGKTSWLGQVMLELDDERWRLGLTLGEVTLRYIPGALDFWQAGTTRLRPLVLSLEYNREQWSFAAEYAETTVRSREYGSSFPFPDNTVQAYYLQATWRFRPRWQSYARYDLLYASKSDKRGRKFEVDTGLPAHLTYAKDFTLGLRYDLDRDWALSMEVHRVQGAASLARTDNPGLPHKDWNLLLLQAAYRF
jgi:hypothetical protein